LLAKHATALRVRIAESYQTYAKSNALDTIATQDEEAGLNNDNDDADELGSDSDDFRSGDSSTSRDDVKHVDMQKKYNRGGRKVIDLQTKSKPKVTDQVVLHDAVILDLKSKMDAMEKLMLAMAKEQKTGSKGGQTSNRGAQAAVVVPASEQARCALLHQPNPVIDITSDGDDSAFEAEEVVTRKPKKTRKTLSRISLENALENDGEAVRDTLKAAQRRVKNKRGSALRYWQDAKTRNCTPHRIYDDILEATADNMPEVLDKMYKLGFAVIRDYNKLRDSSDMSSTYSMFDPSNAPTLEQANYYKTANQNKGLTKPPMDAIFEGVMVNQGSMDVVPVKPSVAREGTDLRSVMTYGTKQYKAYQKLCKGQGEDIVKGLFQNHTKKNGTNPTADPRNWTIAHNVVVGGQDHQHPHCDLGKVGSFAVEEVFPFVAVHGFGVNEFQMWLLPMKKKRDYGFLYQFPKTAVLFLRGDFSHAGACMQEARGHSVFFPQAEAGWDEEYPYWHPSCIEPWLKDPAIFLSPDYRSPPFGWPQLSKRTPSGDQIVTYPADLTHDLLPPEKRKKPVVKRKRSVKEERHVKKEKMNVEDSFEAEFLAAQANQKGHAAV
jgi:hypothetical protein